MQFRCFVSLAWPLYEVFPILIFFIFSLTLMCSFVYILNVDIWQHVLVMSRMRCRVNPHSIVAWMSRNSQLKACCNWTWNQNHWVFVYELSSSRFNSSCSHLTFGLNNEWVHQTSSTFKGKILTFSNFSTFFNQFYNVTIFQNGLIHEQKYFKMNFAIIQFHC